MPAINCARCQWCNTFVPDLYCSLCWNRMCRLSLPVPVLSFGFYMPSMAPTQYHYQETDDPRERIWLSLWLHLWCNYHSVKSVWCNEHAKQCLTQLAHIFLPSMKYMYFLCGMQSVLKCAIVAGWVRQGYQMIDLSLCYILCSGSPWIFVVLCLN